MNKTTLWVSLLVLGALILAAILLLGSSYFSLLNDPAYVEEWVAHWGIGAPLAMIALQTAQVILAPFPGHVLGLASGYLFGAFWGLIYSMIGSIIGSFVNMTLARRFGRPLVLRFVPAATLARLNQGIQRGGLTFFFLVFLVPALPDDIACWAAGLTSLPISALMLVMIAGRAPGMLVSTLLGANAAGISLAQWAVIAVLTLILAAVIILQRERLEDYALRLVNWLSLGRTRRPQD